MDKYFFIRYDFRQGLWNLSSTKADISFTSVASKVSLGKSPWKEDKEEKFYSVSALGEYEWHNHNIPSCPTKQRLGLSSCPSTQFNCADGNCVEMNQRCNQIAECPDGSDEFNCQIIPVINQYQVEFS